MRFMVQILVSLSSHFFLGLLISQLDNYSQVLCTILGWRILHEHNFLIFYLMCGKFHSLVVFVLAAE